MPPDYENPSDADGDNEYRFTLKAAAGDEVSSPLDVTVTVTDEDEDGAVTLSDTRPTVGTALTAALSDPDGVTPGTTTWRWERNDGREGWLEIPGASSANYTPVAADGDRYLRVKATYTDSFGAGKTAEAMMRQVVIAHRLSSLALPGLTGVVGDPRAFYPSFDPDTLHYAARCTESVTLLLTAEDADARISVNGIQRPEGESFTVSGLERESDIRITLTGASGREHDIHRSLHRQGGVPPTDDREERRRNGRPDDVQGQVEEQRSGTARLPGHDGQQRRAPSAQMDRR